MSCVGGWAWMLVQPMMITVSARARSSIVPVLSRPRSRPPPGPGGGRADLEVVPGVVDFGAVGAEDLAGDRQLEDGRAGLDGHGHPMPGERFAHRG